MWPLSEMSLEAATLIGRAANVVLLVSLVAGATATFFISRTGDIKEKYWEEDRRKSAEHVAELNVQLQNAKNYANAARCKFAE